jgi:hypothetical protein
MFKVREEGGKLKLVTVGNIGDSPCPEGLSPFFILIFILIFEVRR